MHLFEGAIMNHNASMALRVLLAAGVAVAVGAVPASAPDKAASTPATAAGSRATGEWKLPPKIRLDPPRFRVTADQQYAIYAAEDVPAARQRPDEQAEPTITYWALARGDGPPRRIIDLLAEEARKNGFEVRLVEPAPSGSAVLVMGRLAGRGSAAYVLELGGGKSRRVGDQPGAVAVWAGDQVALAEADKKQVRPLNIVAPFTGTSNRLTARGMVLAASADASTLVILGDAADVNREVSPEDFAASSATDKPEAATRQANVRLVSVSADGKVLRDLAGKQELGQPPVLSPGGKYVAFSVQPAAAGEERSVRVLATTGDRQRTIKEFALVLAVTDKGETVTFGVGDTSDGTAVKLWDAQGGSRTIVTAAQCAAVAGDRVFYVTPGNSPIIKSAPIRP